MNLAGSSPSAGTTTSRTRPRNGFARPRERTSQGTTERRLSKVAAAINQAWRKAGTDGVKITATDLAGIFLRDGGQCFYCDIEVQALTCSFDHVVPFSRGGTNTLDNIVLCCTGCQRSKFTKSPEQLAEYRALVRYCLTCQIPFKPRYADYARGLGFYHSRSCSAKAASHG